MTCSLTHSKTVVNPRMARIHISSDALEAMDSPAVCQQCEDHPCMDACPTGAMVIDEQLGIVVVHPEDCTGCRACEAVCPYAAIFFDPEKDTALKCDLCGGTPECVKTCRLHALTFPTAKEAVIAAGTGGAEDCGNGEDCGCGDSGEEGGDDR